MHRHRDLVVAVAAASLAGLAACDSSDTSSSSSAASHGGSGTAPACASGSVTASGSTALQPLVQKAATEYMARCGGVQVTVSGGGSSKGLADANAGTSDIGDSDVPASNAKSIPAGALTDHQVAIVIFAVVVNPKTAVTSLSSQQVQDVFSGRVSSWKQVGGADLPISLIERKPGSGTRLTFDKTVMKGTAESATPSSTQDSTQLVLQGVQGADGGVSYINVASAKSVTPVALDGGAPTAGDVASGKYGFFSHEHMYTKGSGSAAAQSFIGFMLSASFQGEVGGLGFIPVSTTDKQSAIDS